jgi:hypothetical protein
LQLSLIQQCLQNSDVFNFADYMMDVVACDILKNVPSDDDKEIAPWYAGILIC